MHAVGRNCKATHCRCFHGLYSQLSGAPWINSSRLYVGRIVQDCSSLAVEATNASLPIRVLTIPHGAEVCDANVEQLLDPGIAHEIPVPLERSPVCQVHALKSLVQVEFLDELPSLIPPNDVLLRSCVLCSVPRQAVGRRLAAVDAWDTLPEPLGQRPIDRECLLARRTAIVRNRILVRVQAHVPMRVSYGCDPGDDEVQAPLLVVGINSLQEHQLEFRDALANYLFALWVVGEVAPPIKMAAVCEVQRLLVFFHRHLLAAAGHVDERARGVAAEVLQHLVGPA